MNDFICGKTVKPEICRFCQLIISEKDKKRKEKEMSDLNIDPNKEKDSGAYILLIIIAAIFFYIMFHVISGINERENARKANERIPGYYRPVSEMVCTSVQHGYPNLRECTI